MGYIRGEDRFQGSLLPESVDDYIGEDNSVRAIEAFVEGLDMEQLGFLRAESARTGRPGYDPKDLLKLYIYGYMQGIRSSRKLEREAGRNLEILWLLRKLRPDFKTIADFRKDNKRALTKAFREFVALCRDLELLDKSMIAIDGSKFKAVNAKGKNYYPEKLNKLAERAEQKIQEYLEELDDNDDDEPPSISGKLNLKEKLELMKKRKADYEKIQGELKGKSQVSLTDPDSRLMPGNNRFEVSYNVQTTTEAKNKLIVDFEITNSASDRHQLARMAKRAQRVLKNKELTALADTGYWEGKQLIRCVKSGILPLVPRRDERGKARKNKVFPKERFTYFPKADVYHCPAGEEMTHRFSAVRKATGKMMKYYSTDACSGCGLVEQCTTNKQRKRRMDRWEHEDVLEELADKQKEQTYRLRQQIVEHPFGTLKRPMNQGYFLTKGMKSVRAEFSLSSLAYNFKRVMNILGPKAFIQALA